MKTGIELVAQERQEQIEKHGITIEKDIEKNDGDQLRYGAMALLSGIEEDFPSEWETSLWKKLESKTEIEQLIIAGAFICAEIDRLQALKK